MTVLDDVMTLPARIHRTWGVTLSSDLAQKALGTYFTRVLVMVLGLLTTVVVSRLLGPSGRGLYAVAAATGAIGVQFSNFGLHTSNTYYAARNARCLPQLVGNSLVVSFVLGGLLSAVVGGVLASAPGLIDLKGTTLFLAMVWIPFGLAYLLIQNLMLGAQDVRGYNTVELANRILVLLLIAFLVMVRWISVPTIFGASVTAMILCFLGALIRLRRYFLGWPYPSLLLFQESFRYASKAYLAGFFCFLVLRADLFMVQHLLGGEQAGYYSIASTMADYASMVATVIGTILFPKLSAQSEIRAKMQMMRKAAWGTAVILVPLLTISSVLARSAIRLLFGAAFLPAAWAFVLLAPGMLFLGIHTVTVQFLNSIGYPKIVVVIWGVCSLFNILVNLWAIPAFGICGASVVSSVCYMLAFGAVLYVIRETVRKVTSGSGAIA